LETLDYILQKFGLENTPLPETMPITIPNFSDRNDLATLFKELEFKNGVEVGVERGRFSKVLLVLNPDLKLHGVDPWTTYQGYRDYVSQDQLDFFLQGAIARLTKHKVISRMEFIRDFSSSAVTRFEDNSLDFVYIDGNHDLLNVILDLTIWSKKVRPGGIISGHDYMTRVNKPSQEIHVEEGVIAFTKSYEISPWFIFGGGKFHRHSFMWVKK
jgi:hypothetical protein